MHGNEMRMVVYKRSQHNYTVEVQFHIQVYVSQIPQKVRVKLTRPTCNNKHPMGCECECEAQLA